MRRTAFATACLIGLSLPPAARADDYRKIMPGVVRVTCTMPGNKVYAGTGVVTIHGILTVAHAIQPGGVMRVAFPEFDADGRVMANGEHYRNKYKLCRIVLADAGSDLAMLLPVGGYRATTVALGGAAKPGDKVSGIGCGSSPFWHCTSGEVRSVLEGVAKTQFGNGIEGRFIYSDMNIVLGDSGSPILNQDGELVGLTIGILKSDNSVAVGVDMVSINQFIIRVMEVEFANGGI